MMTGGLVLLLFLAGFFFAGVRILNEYERGVVFRLFSTFLTLGRPTKPAASARSAPPKVDALHRTDKQPADPFLFERGKGVGRPDNSPAASGVLVADHIQQPALLSPFFLGRSC